MIRLLLVVAVVVYLGVAAGIVRIPTFDFISTSLKRLMVEPETRTTRSTVEGANPGSAPPGVSRVPTDAADVTRPEAPLVQSSPAESSVYVLSDSVPVYVSNSTDSSVLKLLQGGEQVEASLNVLSSKGSWIQVRLDETTAGFIRIEDLEPR